MQNKARGVVARKKGSPVEVVDMLVPDPGPGEALVEVQACGVCPTDPLYREGGIKAEFPYLLGHEAAGIVEAVGPGVTNVRPGRTGGCAEPGDGSRPAADRRVLPRGAVKSSSYSDCLPDRDFPMLVELNQQGRIDLDAFVPERIALDEVEAAFDRMRSGEVLRSAVVL